VIRSTVARVDLAALQSNFRAIQTFLAPAVMLLSTRSATAVGSS